MVSSKLNLKGDFCRLECGEGTRIGVCGGEVNPISRASSNFLSSRLKTVGSFKYFDLRRSCVARVEGAKLVLVGEGCVRGTEVVEEIERMENLRRKEKGRERVAGGDTGEIGGDRGWMGRERVGLNSMGERSGAQSDFRRGAEDSFEGTAGGEGSRVEKIPAENGRFIPADSVDVVFSIDVGSGGTGGIGWMISGSVLGREVPTF